MEFPKQSILTQSLTEAEFIVLTHMSIEALWMLHIIAEIFQLLNFWVNIYSDNQSFIETTYNKSQSTALNDEGLQHYIVFYLRYNQKKIMIEISNWSNVDRYSHNRASKH